jgi:SAM-dependent methyltransferase
MMFGLREEFRYQECADCGCLQLLDVPLDLRRYYPANYLSFGDADAARGRAQSSIPRWVSRLRNSGQILQRPVLGTLLARLRPRDDYNDLSRMFRNVPGLTLYSRVLDVGCGSGSLLFRLAEAGFTNLWGVDPFLDDGVDIDGCGQILVAEMSSLTGLTFDLIMLHHSLEHMVDQRAALKEIGRLLSPQGTCIIRIPVAGSDPWKRYGADWAELDAPRHICLHSPRSLKAIAQAAGLRIAHVEYDGNSLGYWLSELYRRGVSFVDPKAKRYRTSDEFFSVAERAGFDAIAAQANAAGTSGRAAFYLRRSHT